MNYESINIQWDSTPAMWIATRDDYDGAIDSKSRGHVGIGKTPVVAVADLIEKETP